MGIVANISAAFFWSLAAIFYRMATREGLNTVIANILRTPLAISFLFLVIYLGGKLYLLSLSFMDFEYLTVLAVATLVMNIVGDTLYLEAIKRVGVSTAYPLAYSYPIMVSILAYLILNEVITFSLIAGLLSGFFGIWFISKSSSFKENYAANQRKFQLKGIFIALGAALSFSLGIVLFTVSVKNFDPLITGFDKLVLLVAMISPLSYNAFRRESDHPIDCGKVKYALIGGLFGVGVGDWLFYVGLNNVGASISSVITNSSPMISLILSRALLREKITKNQVLGTILIVVGVIIVALRI